MRLYHGGGGGSIWEYTEEGVKSPLRFVERVTPDGTRWTGSAWTWCDLSFMCTVPSIWLTANSDWVSAGTCHQQLPCAQQVLELVSQGAMLCGQMCLVGWVCWDGFTLGAVGLGPLGAGLVRTGCWGEERRPAAHRHWVILIPWPWGWSEGLSCPKSVWLWIRPAPEEDHVSHSGWWGHGALAPSSWCMSCGGAGNTSVWDHYDISAWRQHLCSTQ